MNLRKHLKRGRLIKDIRRELIEGVDSADKIICHFHKGDMFSHCLRLCTQSPSESCIFTSPRTHTKWSIVFFF